MSDRIIFIDANMYLRFYDTSNPKLKLLLKVINEIKEKIFITEQIRDEVNRNKLKVAINSFNANFKELGIKKSRLPEHFDEKYDKRFSEWNKERKTIIEREDVLKKEYTQVVTDILTSIMKSTDNVSLELEKIFLLSKCPSREEIESARIRKELGNPPGKSADPLGDQLTWEQFLSTVGDKEVWIITNDRDFLSEYGKCQYLNPFLYNELKKNSSNNPPKINLFRSLSEGIEDFCEKTDFKLKILPPKEEMELIIIEEVEAHLHPETVRRFLSSSIIKSIGYDKETFTLEVEFQGGSIYQYSNVPEAIYIDLINSASTGAFLNQYIKNAGFPYTKIT